MIANLFSFIFNACEEEEQNLLDIEIEVKDGENQSTLYCVCKQPYDENKEECFQMINCTVCPESYHRTCIGMSEEEYEKQFDMDVQTWVCGRSEICNQQYDEQMIELD